MRGQIAVAGVNGVKARLGAQGGKPRRPDMGRHQIGTRARLQGDFQEMAGIQPQDRSAIGFQVTDFGQAVNQPVDGLKIRAVNQVMDFARFVALFVNRRDLDRQHEAGGRLAAAAGRRQGALNRPLQVGPQAEQARARPARGLSLSSAFQAGWVKSPVPTRLMPFLRAQMARCSRSQFLLVAREYLEWICRSA